MHVTLFRYMLVKPFKSDCSNYSLICFLSQKELRLTKCERSLAGGNASVFSLCSVFSCKELWSCHLYERLSSASTPRWESGVWLCCSLLVPYLLKPLNEAHKLHNHSALCQTDNPQHQPRSVHVVCLFVLPTISYVRMYGYMRVVSQKWLRGG